MQSRSRAGRWLVVFVLAAAAVAKAQEPFEWMGKPFAFWLDVLQRGNARGRREAVDAFSSRGDALGSGEAQQALQALAKALADENVDIRLLAAEALNKLGGPSDRALAARAAMELLSNERSDIRKRAARDLQFYAPADPQTQLEAAGRLLALVKDPNEDIWVRQVGGSSLGQIGDFSAIPALIDLLHTGSVGNRVINRVDVARAIGAVGDTEVTRYRAAPGAGRAALGSHLEALRPAARALLEAARETVIIRDQELQSAYVEALAQLGPAAVPALVETVSGRDRDLLERMVAIAALGDMGPAGFDALAVLETVAKDGEENALLVRVEAERAIAKIEGPEP